jgi:hypothetical protein
MKAKDYSFVKIRGIMGTGPIFVKNKSRVEVETDPKSHQSPDRFVTKKKRSRNFQVCDNES